MFRIKAQCLMFDWQAMVQKEQLGDELGRMRERFEQYVHSSQTKIQQEREAARQENQFLIDDLNKKVGTQFSVPTQHIRSGRGSETTTFMSLLLSIHLSVFCASFSRLLFSLCYVVGSVVVAVLLWSLVVDVASHSFGRANTESSLRQCQKIFIPVSPSRMQTHSHIQLSYIIIATGTHYGTTTLGCFDLVVFAVHCVVSEAVQTHSHSADHSLIHCHCHRHTLSYHYRQMPSYHYTWLF